MIRIILGLLIVMGGVGGVENSTNDLDLFLACLIAAFGLILLHSGARAVESL